MEPAQKPSGTDAASVIENRSGGSITTPGDAGMSRWRRSGFPIDIPVTLYSHEESKAASYSEGKTDCVHANGALLAVTEVFEIGQWLLLINSKLGRNSFVRSASFTRVGPACIMRALNSRLPRSSFGAIYSHLMIGTRTSPSSHRTRFQRSLLL